MQEKSGLVPLYQGEGIVIHGRGIGTSMGMPTANLQLAPNSKRPEAGVYISRLELGNETFYGITHVGTRPTVDHDRDISIETHIIDFNKDIYGRSVKIQLFSKIREPRKFKDRAALLEQIRKDRLLAETFWGITPVDHGAETPPDETK